MTTVVFDEVRTLASDLFGVPAGQLTAESSPQNVPTWDSILHLNLVLAVEEKYNLSLSPEEIEEMKSIGDTAKLIESKLHATPR